LLFSMQKGRLDLFHLKAELFPNLLKLFKISFAIVADGIVGTEHESLRLEFFREPVAAKLLGAQVSNRIVEVQDNGEIDTQFFQQVQAVIERGDGGRTASF